jgi:hypothetical protein
MCEAETRLVWLAATKKVLLGARPSAVGCKAECCWVHGQVLLGARPSARPSARSSAVGCTAKCNQRHPFNAMCHAKAPIQTVPYRLEFSPQPQKYFNFTLPHQPRPLKILITPTLHRDFCLTVRPAKPTQKKGN